MREKSFTKIIFLSFLHFFFPIRQKKNLKIKKNHFFHNFSQGKKRISHFHRLKKLKLKSFFALKVFSCVFTDGKIHWETFSLELLNHKHKREKQYRSQFRKWITRKKNNSSLAPQDFCIILMQSDTWCRKSFSQRILGPLNYFAS